MSGVVGSGKTTLLLEIGEVLEELGRPYALVDLDWLAWFHPAPDAALTVQCVLGENLRAVWGTFRKAGVRRLVLARFLERRAQLEAIREALPEVDVFAVRLAVPAPVLEERLRRRDTAGELAEHLEMAAAGAETAVFEDLVVDNAHDRQPRDVALEILASAGWLPGINPHLECPAGSA